jgi:hypothetical protein
MPPKKTQTSRDAKAQRTTQKPQETSEQTVARINRLFSEAAEARKRYDWKWFLYGLWVRGYHYARYSKETKQIIGKAPTDGRPQVVINKIYPTLRAVRNYALRNKPKAQVIPETVSDANQLKGAMKATKFLEYIHEQQRLRPKLKASVFQALETSSAWWQVLFDGTDITVNEADVFDVYVDPKARDYRNARYIILAVSRSIEALKENPLYQDAKAVLDEITPDNKRSASSYKEMLLDYDNKGVGVSSANKDETSGTVIVKECWYLDHNKVYVATIAGDRLIRKPQEQQTSILPFFQLRADIMPFSLYGEGWVKNLIDPQKMINSAMSSLAEYNLMMNKVKVVTERGSGIRSYNNQHGQFLEVKRGFRLDQVSPAPISNAIYQQLDYAIRFFEDIGSMHDAMSGRVPAGAKSGRAIESLQLGDANNMSELVENIEDFLEDVYEYILYLAANVYQDMRQITLPDMTGQDTYLRVVGETSPVAQEFEQNQPEDVIVLRDKNIVDVQIQSYLSYTPEGKRDSVKELYQMLPDLPPEVLLEAYGVGNTAELVESIMKKRAEDQVMALQQQQMQTQQEQDLAQPESSPQEAVAAIRTMIEGGTPQVPARPSQAYIQAFDQFLAREKELGELDPEIVDAIARFKDQVVQGRGRA